MDNKIKLLIISLLSLSVLGCKPDRQAGLISVTGESARNRIKAPEGFHWVTEASGSFGEFLQHFPLESAGAQVLDYTGIPIANQSEHAAVLKIDLGNRDLQQCADAVIRLRAEYLFATGRENDIGFHFTSGDLFRWEDYQQGFRPIVSPDNHVSFERTTGEDDSYNSFRKYLDVIFSYAGTISLNKETNPITRDEDIRAGDILVNPGSPGHALVILGKAENGRGESLYLLAQGYTPAQSIHILNNPFNPGISPWYELSVNASPVRTPRYEFPGANFRSFEW